MRTRVCQVIISLISVVLISCCAGETTAIEKDETGTAVTVYNQGFGVVRERISLDIKAREGKVSFSDVTAHLEPDSVILRSLSKTPITVIEQDYRNDPVSQGLLLSYYEGKTINFLVTQGDTSHIERGRIVRSGYTPHVSAYSRYGQQYQYAQRAMSSGMQPLIEMNGELQFGLPGRPLFPALPDEGILKPTLSWLIAAAKPGRYPAELCYITGGMSWEADYNVVAEKDDNKVAIIGWVTVDNQTGKSFHAARIKLIAGDVSKVQEGVARPTRAYALDKAGAEAPQVQEKTFGEYHMYTLPRPTDLLDRQTKQVEFIHAEEVNAGCLYIYDGAQFDRYRSRNTQSPEYGTKCNKKVWVMRTIENSKENHLGMPMPKGRLRFYKRDDDGRLEFIGEDVIDHTPRDEMIRVYTGNAFDVVGERKQLSFNMRRQQSWADETFEINVRNHKETVVEVRIVEHLYRWANWRIRNASQEYEKTDSRTIEFPVMVQPDDEVSITYTVHYTW